MLHAYSAHSAVENLLSVCVLAQSPHFALQTWTTERKQQQTKKEQRKKARILFSIIHPVSIKTRNEDDNPCHHPRAVYKYNDIYVFILEQCCQHTKGVTARLYMARIHELGPKKMTEKEKNIMMVGLESNLKSTLAAGRYCRNNFITCKYTWWKVVAMSMNSY